MRNTNVFLLLVILLLFLSYFFYETESFVNYDTHESIIVLTEPGPFDSVQIVYDTNRDYKDLIGDQNNNMINLTDLSIFDKNKRRIPYWNHDVYFEENRWIRTWSGMQLRPQRVGNWPGFPINNLWDDNMDTMGHSPGPRSNLIVGFRSPQEIGSIQITNRVGCCWDRIQNYNLVIYKGRTIVGSRPLRQLGGNRKTVNYTLVAPPPKGNIGVNGDRGLEGPQGLQGMKGDKGDMGGVGPKGERGYKGSRGLKGPTGDIGPRGISGDKGPTGAIGPKGIQGIQGPQGPQGPQGISGSKGELGAIGLEGVVGESMMSSA